MLLPIERSDIMPYDASTLQRARQQYEIQKKQNLAAAQLLRQRAYQENPRIQEIDQELSGTVRALVGFALKQQSTQSIQELRSRNSQLQEERKELLLALGILPSQLLDHYQCDTCKDVGWVGKDLCSCLHAFCVQEQLLELNPLLQGEHHCFEHFKLDYYSQEAWPGTPTSPRENMELIYQNCYAYAHHFQEFPLKNLLFVGSVGIGKSFLSAAIARVVSSMGHSVVYDPAGTIINAFDVRQFRKTQNQDYLGAQEKTKSYLESDLLVLDDLGTEPKTFIVNTALYELVNTRLIHGLHTIISTNLSLEELEARYPPQIISRLLGEYHILQFYGDDLRPILRAQR